MFVYCQNFAGLWGCNFEGTVTVLLNYNSKQFITLINISGDVKLWVRVTLNPGTSMPH